MLHLSLCWFVLVTTIFFAQHTKAGNILCLPNQIPSHVNEITSLVEKLPQRGHSVYIVLQEGYPHRDLVESRGVNVLDFHMSASDREDTHSSRSFQGTIARSLFGNGSMSNILRAINRMCSRDCSNLLHDLVTIQHIRQINFDLALVDSSVVNSCMAIVAEYLGLPFIETFSTNVMRATRTPLLPSFVPVLPFTQAPPTSFVDRFKNTWSLVLHPWIMSFMKGTDYNVQLLNKFTPDKSLDNIRSKAMLHFITRDHILDYPIPSMPHVINTAGLTIRTQQPLLAKFTKIVKESQHGIIVASFGGMAGDFPKDIVNKFVECFRDLKQTVIWKYNGDMTKIDGKVPDNLIIVDWLPQFDLLGQPETKLFITHCGNNGQYESIYHGVPMLGMPLWSEQHNNAERIVRKGFGLKMDITKFTSQQLSVNILEILNNQKYSDNAQKYSFILRDIPDKPQDVAAYWIEHVLKFGAKHLRSEAIDMPLYQYWLIDVIIISAISFLLVVYTIVKCFCMIIKFMCKPSVKMKQA